MKDKIKKMIKSVMPPLLLSLLKDQGGSCKYEGVYHDWSAARKLTTGYDDRQILEKVLAAARKVENGEAVFERDTVLFDQIEYSWPLLVALMLAAARAGGKLNVLDFGGALGTTYRQNKKFLDQLEQVSWNIVEQPDFVVAGQKNIKEKNIKFSSNLDECLEKVAIDLVIFSASIQYVEDPYRVLRKIAEKKIGSIVFDRLITSGQDDFIAIQTVPKCIYEASYPIWIMNENKLKNFFRDNSYELLKEFADPVGGVIKINEHLAMHRGYIFNLIKK